ncbi:MAG: ABC transporter permease [Thermodesulforhabdaceae bacterium]
MTRQNSLLLSLVIAPFSRWQLITSLVKKDLVGRYTGSFLGFFWAILHPVVLVGIYYFVCSLVFRLSIKSGAYGFFEFLICGLIPWIAFSEGISRSCTAVVEQSYLVKKVFFPSEVLIPVAVISSMVQLVIGCGIFLIYLFIAKLDTLRNYWWHLFLLPLPFIIQLSFSIGLGWIVGAVNVFWRDVGHVLPLLMTIWFYATPIVYPYDLLPEAFKHITQLNPLFCLIESYRWVLLGVGQFDMWHLTYILFVSLALYVFGGFFFGKLKEDFSSVM